MCAKDKCSKIVSRSAAGDDFIIKGNRRVWTTEDGTEWVTPEAQYQGPVGAFISDGRICNNGGYMGPALGSIGGRWWI